jgi:glyoxylase-like metal-dependent hydrolase (beta-lactamase superfamily II)
MAETTASEIDVAALRALLERGDPVTVLDVRSAADRAEWAIPGSLHVAAYDALKAGDPQALAHVALPKGQPIVTVCGMGQTAALATAQLRARGLPARTLVGGMRAWSLAWNVTEVPVPGSAARVVQVRRTGKGCLSYLIGSAGEAAVLDASLDPAVYLELARRYGWRITTVLDTHVHADHLSRSRTLAGATGARLYLPATERASFPFTPLRDGVMVAVGAAHLAVLHTPGHTPEGASYLLDQRALFSGDTLFLVGVGRPDLEASREEARERAQTLYQSLQRLLSLPGQTLVLPGHTGTPVPFDGRPLVATLADVRQQLAAFPAVEDDFVEAILARIPPTPPNHARIVALNEAGLLPEGDPTELEAGANRCAVA